MEEAPQTPNEPVDPTPAEPAPQAAPVEPVLPVAGDDKNLAVLAHVLAIFTGFLAPLIIFIMTNDKKGSFARDQSAEALNFQITLLIAWVVAGVLSCLVIGFFLMPVILVASIVFCILAALAASRGEAYRYPFALRLIS
jgi:uncharacterized protein